MSCLCKNEKIDKTYEIKLTQMPRFTEDKAIMAKTLPT